MGILRYENSKWNVYSLMADGQEFTTGGKDIRTDGETIAWFTKGSNFVEFSVWQRVREPHTTERYVARELASTKQIFDEIFAKRVAQR
jgi:hypothetical protein